MLHFRLLYNELVKKAIIKRCGVMLSDEVRVSQVILGSESDEESPLDSSGLPSLRMTEKETLLRMTFSFCHVEERQ